MEPACPHAGNSLALQRPAEAAPFQLLHVVDLDQSHAGAAAVSAHHGGVVAAARGREQRRFEIVRRGRLQRFQLGLHDSFQSSFSRKMVPFAPTNCSIGSSSRLLDSLVA